MYPLTNKQYNRDPHNVPPPDKDFMVVALDLLGGIVQGIGRSSEKLINAPTEPTIFTLLKIAMKDETPDVRSCAFALLGDLATHSFQSILPHIPDFISLVIGNITVDSGPMSTSAMNNATWSSGEIAMRHGHNMAPFVNPLLQKLIPVLLSPVTPRSLCENSAITIGRLGLACGAQVAPYLEQFIQNWCEVLSRVHDNAEKASAFQGICKVIKLNPNGVVKSFAYFCDAVLKWDVTHQPELKHTFLEVISI